MVKRLPVPPETQRRLLRLLEYQVECMEHHVATGSTEGLPKQLIDGLKNMATIHHIYGSNFTAGAAAELLRQFTGYVSAEHPDLSAACVEAVQSFTEAQMAAER